MWWRLYRIRAKGGEGSELKETKGGEKKGGKLEGGRGKAELGIGNRTRKAKGTKMINYKREGVRATERRAKAGDRGE